VTAVLADEFILILFTQFLGLYVQIVILLCFFVHIA